MRSTKWCHFQWPWTEISRSFQYLMMNTSVTVRFMWTVSKISIRQHSRQSNHYTVNKLELNHHSRSSLTLHGWSTADKEMKVWLSCNEFSNDSVRRGTVCHINTCWHHTATSFWRLFCNGSKEINLLKSEITILVPQKESVFCWHQTLRPRLIPSSLYQM